jgi:hypothetical protein
MRPSENFEAKDAGQKWLQPHRHGGAVKKIIDYYPEIVKNNLRRETFKYRNGCAVRKKAIRVMWTENQSSACYADQSNCC